LIHRFFFLDLDYGIRMTKQETLPPYMDITRLLLNQGDLWEKQEDALLRAFVILDSLI